MSKQLVKESNFMNFVRGSELLMTRDMILTPGAKDACRKAQITIVYGSERPASDVQKKAPETAPENSVADAMTEINRGNLPLEHQIMQMLRKEYGIKKEEDVQRLTKRILEILLEKK